MEKIIINKNMNSHTDDLKMIFKPISKKYTNFIDITSIEKIIIQFTIKYKLIDNLTFNYNDKEYKIKKKSADEILINCELSNNSFLIQCIPVDMCSEIIIDNIKIFDNNEYYNIYWDKIYIINLKKREDRKNKLIDELINAKIDNYEFIDAIDGNDEIIKNDYKKLKENKNTKIKTSGHYACLLSHIYVIEKAIENNYEQILILEDDIQFVDDFLDRLKEIKLFKYDLVYLGGLIPEYKFLMTNWCKHNSIMCTYSYIINKNIYNDVLSIYKSYLTYADVLLKRYIQKNINYNVYLLNDYVFSNFDDSNTSKKKNKFNKMIYKIQNKLF
jgi:GR25 family glycosyltransferase involved in LPS biosynthesis